MISGATRGAGGSALGAHVASMRGGQDVRMGASRGLVSETIRDQVAELTDLVSHSRSRRPIYHVHADPPPGAKFSEAAWGRYWDRFEAELGLGEQVFAEQVHVKQGREHRHREYSLVRPDGTTMPLSHDHARREKIGRLTEIEEGQQLTAGAHNRAVAAALDREGRRDAAAAIRDAGLDRGPRPRSPITPDQRAQAERTGTDPKAVGAAVLTAWHASDDGASFRVALAEQGFRLAQGDRAAVVLDATGNVHALARLLGKESKAAGGDRIAAGDVSARLAGVDLPRHVPGAAVEPTPVVAAVETPPAPVKSPATPESAALHAGAAAAEASAAPPVTQPATETAPAPEKAESAPAGMPAHSPISGGRAPSSGGDSGSGGGNGGGSDPFASIAPLDLSKPNDWLRFLNQTANAQAQKLRAEAAADAARTTTNGGSHAAPNPHQPSLDYSLADAIADAIQLARENRVERAASAAVEPHLDRRGPARAHGDGDGRPGRDAADPGPQGTGPDPVRGGPVGHHDGLPPPPPEPPGAAAVEGNEPAGPDHRAPRASRGKPDQNGAEAGRTRIVARRASLGLAAAVDARGGRLDALTQALASLPTAAGIQTDRARAAMAASRARVAAVLQTAPWPDPADRNRGRLQDAGRDRVRSAMDARAAAAASALARAEQLRGRVGLVARVLAVVGIQTPSERAAAEAAREAQHAERDAKTSRLDYREDLAQADRSGTAEASRRQRDQDRWEDRPDVRAARREEAGNRQVVAAVKAGDCEIKAALAQEDGLRIARELITMRKAERLAEVQRKRLHEQRTAVATELKPGPAVQPAPRFRR